MKKQKLKHASLFSGIGGFDLAAEWMEWENIFQCEIEWFPRQILKYYWPKTIQYENIKTTDFRVHRGQIDVLTGGFPCQPYSMAGQRRGTEDDRHLWPEMLRAIREIQPRWVVGENVYGIVNWNGGLVFEEVQADLEAEGYEVQSVILPACGKDAPHRRERTWFVAHSESFSWSCKNKHDRERKSQKIQTGRFNEFRLITNTKNKRLERANTTRGERSRGFNSQSDWQNFPTQSPVCSGDDGIPSKLDGITFPKWRNESIKAYGNAVVPQLVYEIFKVIDKTI